VTPSNSVVLAGFASAAGRYRTISNAGDKQTTLVNVVNLYVSPFGEQKVEINRFQKAKNTLIFEPDMWKKPRCVRGSARTSPRPATARRL
jgi:hypothetical protein